MQQIPASPPAEPAAASKSTGNKSASSKDGEGSFTTALFGAASAEAPQVKGADAASGTAAAKAAAKNGQKGDGDKGEHANSAAAITAAVMEAIQQRQQGLTGGQAGKAGDGTALGTTVGAPGRTGQTPANGAPAPGQAGTAPGLAGTTPGQTGKAGGQGTADGTIAAATPGGPGKSGKTEALPIKPQVDGIPTDSPKTDAHGAREAQAAIQAGALQSSAEKNAQAGAQTADGKLAAAHNEARATEPGRRAPTPSPSASELMQGAADASNKPGATAQAAATTAQSADVQPATTPSPGLGLATAADGTQPGSAAQPRPVMPAQPVAEQVAVHIQRAATEGLDRIMIHLNPPELGRVDVRMEVQHDGRIHAVIAADTPDALDALRHDVRGLERALNDAGLKTDQNALSFELRGGNNGGAGQSPGQQAGADIPDDAEFAELGEQSDEEGSSLLLDGVVDIRV